VASSWGRRVRVDQFTSADPDWDGAKISPCEHSMSFPTYGHYSVYGVIDTRSGDQAAPVGASQLIQLPPSTLSVCATT
jgi:hypothetical protein